MRLTSAESQSLSIIVATPLKHSGDDCLIASYNLSLSLIVVGGKDPPDEHDRGVSPPSLMSEGCACAAILIQNSVISCCQVMYTPLNTIFQLASKMRLVYRSHRPYFVFNKLKCMNHASTHAQQQRGDVTAVMPPALAKIKFSARYGLPVSLYSAYSIVTRAWVHAD